MSARFWTIIVSAAALAACGSEPAATPESEVSQLIAADGAPEAQFGFSEAMEPGPTLYGSAPDSVREAIPIMEAPAQAQTPPAAGEQIAYSYEYGYRVDATDLDQLLRRHVALCDAMGADCRVLSQAKSGNGDYAYGEVKLEVVASKARAFGASLDNAIDGFDAERISFGQAGENLSKSIIDTAAQLESRKLLRERLMGILRSRQGSVGDLVEAEKAVAQVNQEIDSATAELAGLRGRVSYSAVDVRYDPTMGEYTLGFLPPIRMAISTIGTTLGIAIAGIIYVTIALIPILPFLLLLRWLWRRSGLRIRRQRGDPTVEAGDA
jgi:hypothetical protein